MCGIGGADRLLSMRFRNWQRGVRGSMDPRSWMVHDRLPRLERRRPSLMLLRGGGTMMVFSMILRGLTASGLPATVTHQALGGVAQACATQAYRPPFSRSSRYSLYPRHRGVLCADFPAAHGQQLFCVDEA